MEKRLNLGCGTDLKEGYLNIDRKNYGNPKIFEMELNKYPWNLPNNHFEEIYLSHILEHLNIEKALLELIRISKPGAFIKIRVPHHSNPHKRLCHTYEGFNTETFLKGSINQLDNSEKLKAIKQLKVKLFIRSTSPHYMKAIKLKLLNKIINNNKLQNIYERLFCYILPSSEIHYLLKIEK
jgi:ubiquinone/menaquinone biosynthesis C-methylase UbiE